jgi:hypothetical protein
MTMRGLAKRRWCTHLLADLEVGDDAVLQGADRLDVRRRAADHALRLGADRQGAAVLHVDGDHRRLVQDDAAAADVDKGVGRAQVDRHVTAEQVKAII